MHNKIYNMIILTFKGEDDVMDEMEAQCGKLGPPCMAYLEDQYNAAVNNLGVCQSPGTIFGLLRSPA
eukprot:4469285-Prymnesium_polylepis.1